MEQSYIGGTNTGGIGAITVSIREVSQAGQANQA